MCLSCPSLLRGIVKCFHYLFAVVGCGFLFASIWILVETYGSGFGFAILICSLYTIGISIFGIYSVGYGDDKRVKIWFILMFPYFLLQLAITFAWILTPTPLQNAIKRSNPEDDPMDTGDWMSSNEGLVTAMSVVGEAIELFVIVLTISYYEEIASNPLEEEEDPILQQREKLREKGLLPEQQQKHQKTNRVREKLNDKYGNIFNKNDRTDKKTKAKVKDNDSVNNNNYNSLSESEGERGRGKGRGGAWKK